MNVIDLIPKSLIIWYYKNLNRSRVRHNNFGGDGHDTLVPNLISVDSLDKLVDTRQIINTLNHYSPDDHGRSYIKER